MAVSAGLLSVAALTADDIRHLIRDAADLKQGKNPSALSGKTIALVFEKPSLRTRVSFEVAARQLGGEAIYLSPVEVGLGKRESIPDVARTLSRYVDGIVARTFAHRTVELLAEYAHVPVVNGLSDHEHPCQALGDMLTIHEKKGRLTGLSLVFVGDGNNVARSLLFAASLVGMNFCLASPVQYRLDDASLDQARKFAAKSGAGISSVLDPRTAVANADIVYTDVWTSMGQESESDVRRAAFASYQLNSELLALASEEVLFMHPLPAHHGEEIAAGLLDHPRSVVFDQAENRLHIQKAILAEVLGRSAT